MAGGALMEQDPKMDADKSLAETVTRLGAGGASRFPRWDAAMWRSVLEGPAAALAEAMESAGRPDFEVRAVLVNYLRLAAEGVGLGYLYPDSAGRRNFFSKAWTEILPRDLPSLGAAAAADALAACWNLGENLEKAQPWVSAAFMAVAGESLSLASLESSAARALDGLFDTPGEELSDRSFKTELVFTAAADRAFMPGRIRFIAPVIVEICDRSRGVDGGPRAAIAVWLKDPPEVLGPATPSVEEPPIDASPDPIWELARRLDPRITGIAFNARNPWRAVASLKTSQYVAVASVRGPGSAL